MSYEYEERCAIKEYDGGMDRETAEEQAFEEALKQAENPYRSTGLEKLASALQYLTIVRSATQYERGGTADVMFSMGVPT